MVGDPGSNPGKDANKNIQDNVERSIQMKNYYDVCYYEFGMFSTVIFKCKLNLCVMVAFLLDNIFLHLRLSTFQKESFSNIDCNIGQRRGTERIPQMGPHKKLSSKIITAKFKLAKFGGLIVLLCLAPLNAKKGKSNATMYLTLKRKFQKIYFAFF